MQHHSRDSGENGSFRERSAAAAPSVTAMSGKRSGRCRDLGPQDAARVLLLHAQHVAAETLCGGDDEPSAREETTRGSSQEFRRRRARARDAARKPRQRGRADQEALEVAGWWTRKAASFPYRGVRGRRPAAHRGFHRGARAEGGSSFCPRRNCRTPSVDCGSRWSARRQSEFRAPHTVAAPRWSRRPGRAERRAA